MTVVTWNPADKAANMSLANGNLDAINLGNVEYNGVRGTTAFTTSKRYIEYKIIATPTPAAVFVGLANINLDVNNSNPVPSGDAQILWRGNGTVWFESTPSGNSLTYAANDVCCLAIDRDTGKVWINKNNGAWLGGGDPATGATPTGTIASGLASYPLHITDNAPAGSFNVRIHGDSSNQDFSPPSGFSSWTSASANPHIVGKLTQLHPQHATGSRYGSFLGRTIAIPPVSHPVPILTQLHPQHATGGRYGSFRRGAQPTPPTPPTGNTFIFVRRSAKRLRDRTRRGCRVIR